MVRLEPAYKYSMKSRLGFNFFDVFVYVFTGLFSLLCLYPLWYVIIGSLTPGASNASQAVVLLPTHGISLDCYAVIVMGSIFQRSIMISLSKTVLTSVLQMLVTAMIGYAVSKIHIKGMKVLNFLIVFTMYFGGGLIPFYLLMIQLHLFDTYWVYIFPSLISPFNFILLRNYYQTSMESSLEESAMIDGGTEITVFFRIVIPLSVPILSALFLFTAVGQWNDFTTYLFYIPTNIKLKPFIMVLRDLLVDPTIFAKSQGGVDANLIRPTVVATNLKMATIVVALLPIMLLYPFLQKNFTAGIMVGAVKE